MSRSRIAGAALLVLAAILPFYLESFWLQAGLFAMASAIGAIGLTILTGTAGLLSLGHAFFVAVGAYGYCYFAGGGGLGVSAASGLHLPPLLAMVLAVALAGLLGALYSPISGRLRGIYLGIASIGLVFIGQHIMFNASGVTGGFNGRDAQPFSLAGFSFTATDPELTIMGVQITELERLWYLGIVLLAIAYYYGRHLTEGRPGRALETVRDSEVAAAVMGVDVTRYKAAAFTVSSMYAGLAGVLLALIYNRIVPESFGLALSVEFLAMIVIGGLGSVRGAVLGGFFVSLLPKVLDHYSDSLPFLAQPGSGSGVEPGMAARFAFGAAIVAILLFAPGGLGALGRRLRPSKSLPMPTAAPSTPKERST
ncbi:MAG: branched-chain amino acid transport system permease protein [Solirubrobacterales bacterium]|nr:branched-chain amino acid transport system permease protein [Solirubrobacterales bacterium]